MKTQIETLEADAKEKEKTMQKLKSDRDRLFNALNGVLKDKEKLQAELEELTQANTQTSSQHQEELEQRERQRGDLLLEIEKYRQMQTELQSKNAQLEEELRRLKDVSL